MYNRQPKAWGSIEQALHESQARLDAIIASAMDAIITIDEDVNILLFNSAAEEMFGYPVDQVVGRPLDMLIPERFRLRHRAHIRRFGETGVTNRTMGKLGRIFGLRSDGTEFQIEASISQVETESGKLFTVILRDVTERVEAEEKLVESEQRLMATFDQAAVGIGHISLDGRWLLANPRLCAILGYRQDEMLSRTIADFSPLEDLAREREFQSQAIAGEISNYVMEKRYTRKDGSTVWANLMASLVRDRSGEPKYFVKFIEDITARRAAEEALRAKTEEMRAMTQQLWQTAKLATMGELSASVAHELNNPLAILSLRLESLAAAIPEATPERRSLSIMEGEIERMASIVTNLLQFSRSGQRQISTLDLREEADRTMELIHSYLTNRRVTVQREFADDLPHVLADRQQMRQLLLNLFTNSADAMSKGGTLTVAIFRNGSGHVVVEIRDTGSGIRPEDLPRVMEPFFTTKPSGKGTGLGLPICRRIVEEHDGTFRIDSLGLDLGTTVRIELPIAAKGRQAILPE